MSSNKNKKNHSEAVVYVLITILERTPYGGATLEDIREAYIEAKGKSPDNRTLYRILERLELMFDPLARGETPEENEEPEDDEDSNGEEFMTGPRIGINRVKKGRKTYYIFKGELAAPEVNVQEALLTALSLYPQQQGLLKDAFQKVMEKLFVDALTGVSMYTKIINDINAFVYVAEPLPSKPEKFTERINKLFQALTERKKIKIDYWRTYDGELTTRVVSPYGLLNRFNNWYLCGYCNESKGLRIFHLLHVRELEVLDQSTYTIPKDFSLQELYYNSWAMWTTDEKERPEVVRLRVSSGAAERFRNLDFHPSQIVNELSSGDIEVIFRVQGANEMVPWLVSWGAAIKVLEPEWLREKVITNLQKTIEHYRNTTS